MRAGLDCRLAWSDGFPCRLPCFAFIAFTLYAQTRLAPAGVSAATESAMLLVTATAVGLHVHRPTPAFLLATARSLNGPANNLV